jgi:uncharacterized protein YecE (DUF72 family)
MSIGVIRVGTSGWNYPTGRGTWNGIFYPTSRGRGFDELAYYAEHFDVVEVNSTFYRPPEPALSASWLRRTPASFQFAVKLFQKFTHPDMYLARPGAGEWDIASGDIDQFRAGVDPIAQAGRLAALLMQFPPSFHANPESRDYLSWLMARFAAYPLAVELRHRSWSDERTDTQARLDDARAAWVFIDEPKFDSSIAQHLADSATGHAASSLWYVRLHGRRADLWWEHEEAEDRYNYLYSPQELEPFASTARKVRQTGRRAVLLFNNHFSAKAVANAAILKHQLGDLLPGDYPRDFIDRYPELEGVVRTSGLF